MRFVRDGDSGIQLEQMLNQGLTFVDNMDGVFLEIQTESGAQSIQHGLGRKPIGFLVIFKDAEADIWGANLSSWTNEILFLRSSATNVMVRLFVM